MAWSGRPISEFTFFSCTTISLFSNFCGNATPRWIPFPWPCLEHCLPKRAGGFRFTLFCCHVQEGYKGRLLTVSWTDVGHCLCQQSCLHWPGSHWVIQSKFKAFLREPLYLNFWMLMWALQQDLFLHGRWLQRSQIWTLTISCSWLVCAGVLCFLCQWTALCFGW